MTLARVVRCTHCLQRTRTASWQNDARTSPAEVDSSER